MLRRVHIRLGAATRLVAVGCLLLPMVATSYTGCGGGGEGAPAPGSGAVDTVLKVGSSKPFKTANLIGDDWYNVLASITTHDSLVRLDTDVQPSPWLATEWEISPDSRVFTFTITDRAKWHDGVPLTAEDVEFSIEYYRDNVAFAGWMKDVIDTVEAEGNEVTVNLKKPYGNFLIELMSYDIVPRHIWGGVEDPEAYAGGDVAVGSGPFILEEWDQSAGRFTFIANEEYFQGMPGVDRLEVEVFSNMDALVMALAQGEIDTWWDYSGEFPYTYVPTLLKAGDIEFASATFLGVPAALGFNLERYPTSELAFRQAVAKAIDYEQIANLVYHGYGTVPTYGFVPSTHPNFDTSVAAMEYAPDQAATLLSSLGLQDADEDGILEDADGEDIVLTLLVRSDKASLVRCAEVVRSQLEDMGIGVQFKSVDFSTWYSIKEDSDYDIAFFRCTPWGTMMHAGHGSGYFDSRRTGMGVLHNLDAEEYLDACDARLATALPEQQRDLDFAIQQLHEDYLPGIALVWIESIYPYRAGWEGWVIDQVFGGVVNSYSWSTVARSVE
jgi:peptide/nickel transport system substrate-binding protein